MPIEHSELCHRVQNRTGDSDLRYLCWKGSASKDTAKLILEAPYSSLDETSPCEARFFLPTASTDALNMFDVRISLDAIDT